MRLTERIGLMIRANLGRLRRDQDPTETKLRRADKMEALLEQLEARLNRAAARQVKLAAKYSKLRRWPANGSNAPTRHCVLATRLPRERRSVKNWPTLKLLGNLGPL